MLKQKNLIKEPYRTILFIAFLVLVIGILLFFLLSINIEKSEESKIQSFSLDSPLVNNDFDLIKGNKDSLLTIIVYENYLDAFSQQLYNTLKQVEIDYGDKIEFIYRPFIMKGNSLTRESAMLVSCANYNGKGLEARDLFFKNNLRTTFNLNDLSQYINTLGLDENEFMTCFNSREKRDKLMVLQAETDAAYILGTPTILVGSELIIGARPYDNFIDSNEDKIEGLKSVIDRQLERARVN